MRGTAVASAGVALLRSEGLLDLPVELHCIAGGHLCLAPCGSWRTVHLLCRPPISTTPTRRSHRAIWSALLVSGRSWRLLPVSPCRGNPRRPRHLPVRGLGRWSDAEGKFRCQLLMGARVSSEDGPSSRTPSRGTETLERVPSSTGRRKCDRSPVRRTSRNGHATQVIQKPKVLLVGLNYYVRSTTIHQFTEWR